MRLDLVKTDQETNLVIQIIHKKPRRKSGFFDGKISNLACIGGLQFGLKGYFGV